MGLTNNQKMGISLRGKVKGLNFFRNLFYVVILIVNFLVLPAKADVFAVDDFNDSSLNAKWGVYLSLI